MSWEVGPAGFATTRTPSSPGPGAARATSAPDLGGEPRRPRRGRGAGIGDRHAIVAPAARAWPPPPNRPGQDRRVHAARPRPDADARPLARVGLLEEDRHLGVLGLRQQVDDALGVGALRRRSPRESASVRVDQTTRPSSAISRRSSTRAEEPELGVRLRPVEAARDVRQRGAGRHERGGDGERPRGRVGWAKVAVSMTIPAISAVASAPPPASRGTPSRAARSATISQVAAAPGSIQSASPAPCSTRDGR